ncbi:MAG: hypothetical protein ACE5H2_09585 [Terriglobia bacterium]
MKRMLPLLLATALAAPNVFAHEPIFGLGPRTIWKNGIGFETELEREREELDRIWALKYELLYGITPDLAITLELPHLLQKQVGTETDSGLGDILLRGKWRFYRHEVWGGMYQAAVLGGVEFPTGDTAGVGLGSGSYDYFLGLAGGYEGRRWLGIGAARYRFNTQNAQGFARPDVVLYDLAVGIRPVKTAYTRPDVVFMFEINGEVFRHAEQDGRRVPGTSGDRMFAALGTWITYRNWAFKPGIQLPLAQHMGPLRQERDLRAVFAVEFHY